MESMNLVLDAEDFATIQGEIDRRKAEGRENTMPGGGSNLVGEMIAEMVRDLDEYRSWFAANRAETSIR